MATFGIVIVIGIAALIAYVLFGGPRIPADLRRVIDEVVASEVPELVEGDAGFASSGSVRLWYEDRRPPVPEVGTVLLLMSMGGDALMWPRAFLDRLLGAGFRVVRFDQRETGLSDRVEGWRPRSAYTVGDLAEDAVAVLDHLAVDRAHLCGLSLGGMVAQEVAIRHPDRVASLVLMSTSPDVTDASLPTLSTRYLLGSAWKGLPLLRYRIAGGERNLVTEPVAKMLAFGLRPSADDVRDLGQLVLYDLRKRRGINLSAGYHHQVAAAAAAPRGAALANLHVPTLVVHGEADPIFRIAHGRRLASTIPGARGLWLEGAGHGFPYPDLDGVMDAIVHHLRDHGDAGRVDPAGDADDEDPDACVATVDAAPVAAYPLDMSKDGAGRRSGSIFDAVGGSEGVHRLAHAWHERASADEVVGHAFERRIHPQHTERLAAYWGEAWGGPPTYTERYGTESDVVRIHSGNGPHEEMDRRAIECFDRAMDDVGLEDPLLRRVLHDYFEWTTTTTMAAYPLDANDVPDGLTLTRWSWDGVPIVERHGLTT